jgi:phosphomannomutase
MLGDIARSLGVRYEETLTGFKWIANVAMDREREGYRFVFGYEEALGYAVGDVVRDKDGISAAVLGAELTAFCRARGSSLLQRLEMLYRRHGLYVSVQRSVTFAGTEGGTSQGGALATGATKMAERMAELRRCPPTRLGRCEVTAVRDYLERVPASDVLAFDLGEQGRIVVRPSGTEPKMKYYFDRREPIAEGESLVSAEARAHAIIAELAAALGLS